MSLRIESTSIEVPMEKGPDIVDITGQVEQFIVEAGIGDGVVAVMATGSTGSVTTIEFEPGVVADLKRVLKRLAPPDGQYEHERAWQDGNGHSHIQAALLGPSETLPVRNGRLACGTWQQVVLINHDNRARTRSVELTVTGT